MRYHIRRSLGLPSGGDRSIFDNSAFASQNRGRIIAFIFILSSVTTLVSFLTFHNGSSSGSSHTGILTLDKAAKMFAINRGRGAHSSEIMKKRQMYDYLKQRHNDEIKSLKWLLVRGSRGRSNNMTTRIEDSFEENVSGVENNITVTSGDFGVAVSPLLINFLRTVPSNYTQRLPSGVFVEYYPYGGNTSLSLTLPLEQSQAWRGVVLYAGKDEAGKVRSQRRFTTFVGADLKLCLPEDYRLKSKNNSGHLKNTLPHPHPLPAPPVVVVEPDPREDEHKLDSRQPKRNIIDEPSSPKGFSESGKFSKPKHLVDRKLRCLSLFSLTQLFKCYTIDFFAIHTSGPRYGRDLEKILKTLLALRPLIEIKVISIAPIANSELNDIGLKRLIHLMAKANYKYQSLPLYSEKIIESIISGESKINGPMSKHAVIKDLYKNTVKQHLFVSNKAYVNVAEHFRTYFHL